MSVLKKSENDFPRKCCNIELDTEDDFFQKEYYFSKPEYINKELVSLKKNKTYKTYTWRI